MARTEGPRMDEHTYAVSEILSPQQYTVKASPHDLERKVEKLSAAGLQVHFPARLPDMQAVERRKYLLENGDRLTSERHHLQDYQVSPDAEAMWQYLAKGMLQSTPEKRLQEEFPLINGIYTLTNIGTHQGELKAVQPVRPWSNEGERKRHLNDGWAVYLDPVTAETLGIAPEPNLREIRDKDTRATLLQIQLTRDLFRLSPKDLAWLLEQKQKGKLRF